MNQFFDSKWFITLLVSWLVIIALDELAHYWWRDMNPGHIYSRLIGKPSPPLRNPFPDEFGSGVPNGYRPAGGI